MKYIEVNRNGVDAQTGERRIFITVRWDNRNQDGTILKPRPDRLEEAEEVRAKIREFMEYYPDATLGQIAAEYLANEDNDQY